MEPAIALGVGNQATAFLVEITAFSVVFAACFGEVVVVNEVVARIVWGSV